jgi:hypothetical protein
MYARFTGIKKIIEKQSNCTKIVQVLKMQGNHVRTDTHDNR